MITTRAQGCTCQRMKGQQPSDLCAGRYTFEEKGKEVKFVPRQQEETQAIALDGCVFRDNQIRCDGLFLWRQSGGGRKVAALVELKGASDIPRGYEQLAHVRRHRQEYHDFVNDLNTPPGELAKELAFIVTNGALPKPQQENLEHEYGIRVRLIMHSSPTGPTPDLRERI